MSDGSWITDQNRGFAWWRSRLLLAFLVAVAGCSIRPPSPAFEAELPASIPDDVRELAVVGDLQLTSALVRRMRGREDNRTPQRVLMDDLASRSGEYAALVIVGDLVYSARSPKDWRHFDSLVGSVAASRPILPAIGNHDYHCIFFQLCWQNVVPKRFRARFPWMAPGRPYMVSWGEAVLVFLDSETALEEQAQWLRVQLESAQDEYSVALVFFHRPPFTNSIDRGAHDDEDVKQLIVPVLDAAPIVSVVFNGHVHGYEHLLVGGVHYFTTAGGGGPRGMLGAVRTNDVYTGRDCEVDASGAVLRPFNYLLIAPSENSIRVDVEGFCRQDEGTARLESVEIPTGGRTGSRLAR